MPETEFHRFRAWALRYRSKNKLHPIVEAQLARLLALEFPESYVVREVSAVKGGRNDLLQYQHDGKRAVFELFFSISQVSQDLRLLELAEAHWKVAVLLDEELKPDLAREYFHKKPDAFPHLWLSQVMMPGKWSECRKLLRQLLTAEPLDTGTPAAGVTQIVTGDRNTIAGRDIIKTEKHVSRPTFNREPDDISEETAHAIRELIRR